MSSVWRLISAEQLCCSYGPGVQYKKQLPHSIAAELKTFAQRKMTSAEEKVIDEICSLIPHAFNKVNSDTPAVWASLWSVILVYRQALQMVGSNAAAFKDGFGDVTRRLLDALIVTLSDHFRTRKILDAVDSPLQPSFLGQEDVMAAFELARRERRILCKCVLEESHTAPTLMIKALIRGQTTRFRHLDAMVMTLSRSMSSRSSRKSWGVKDPKVANRTSWSSSAECSWKCLFL